MKLTNVIFNAGSFGITQKSLKMLRDTLAEKLLHRIAVVEVPTNDLCCGYFIFDLDGSAAVFTGDGFRTDRMGEGGAGYMSAEALFEIYRVRVIPWEPVSIEAVYQLPEEDVGRFLLKIAQEIADQLTPGEFSRPKEKNPL